ncbi:uncharacterized [Tachysurus ichikawai]
MRLFLTRFLLQTVSAHQLYRRSSALSSARNTAAVAAALGWGHVTVPEEQEEQNKSTTASSDSRLTRLIHLQAPGLALALYLRSSADVEGLRTTEGAKTITVKHSYIS